LSLGRFLLETLSESFEEGGCGLPSDEQAAKERRNKSLSPSISNNANVLSLSIHYLQNNSFIADISLK
jgi:hypothetical protein